MAWSCVTLGAVSLCLHRRSGGRLGVLGPRLRGLLRPGKGAEGSLGPHFGFPSGLYQCWASQDWQNHPSLGSISL